MPKVIILGVSNAIPTFKSENTHMLIAGKERTVLVDSVSNPVVRLEQAGIDCNTLTDIIITHFHPDHASGIPLLLMDMWLMGRDSPLMLHGLADTLDRIEKMMELYTWGDWPNFYPVKFNRLPSEELTTVLDSPEFVIKSSPVHHMIPNIGLRVDFKESGRSMAYSCDTEPCDEVVRLGHKADVLIHEATGDSFGHSSAFQAGQIASRAKAKKLYLIHYGTGRFSPKVNLVEEARKAFSGEIELAVDFMNIDFNKRMPLSHFGRGAGKRKPSYFVKPSEP